MRTAKLLAIALGVYVGIVVAFEALIGILQPAGGDTLVITTTGEDGESRDRVVSRLESDGKLYVAANHWPRAWYERALANPEVEIVVGGERTRHVAVPVTGAEHDRVDRDNRLRFAFRIMTGFPPRYFLRLDPRT
ncbi:MAG: nitroreductase/quinone reductase family protein [Myxococcota bacterium]|nr:nitroreductase/quinone reductase family protein [Myxococcota bacterium]